LKKVAVIKLFIEEGFWDWDVVVLEEDWLPNGFIEEGESGSALSARFLIIRGCV